MVALLAIVPIIVPARRGLILALYLVGFFCILGVAWAVWRSKTESKEFREMESELGRRPPTPTRASRRSRLSSSSQ